MSGIDEPRVIYKLYSKVLMVEERFKEFHTGGYGPDAGFERRSLGWYLHLEGSYEAIYLGQEKPDLRLNEMVEITITRRTADAQSSQGD